MANYSNNYKGSNSDQKCKLCQNHGDNQHDIYICDFNQTNIKLSGKYNDLFKGEIDISVIKSLEALYKSRENKLSWANPAMFYPQVHTFYPI